MTGVFRLYLLFICLAAFGSNVQSQIQFDTDLDKYWWYRARLIGDGDSGYPGFVVVGDKPGHSIPMSGKNPAQNCMTDYWINRENCTSRPGEGKLRWVDATLHMGHYMAMLALEYRMLSDAGEKTNRTEQELYYVLKALERLDYTAYEFIGRAPQLDGFFIRDDIPADFHWDAEKTDYRFKNYTGGAYHCVQSSAACGLEKTFDKGYFVSQDQIISLFFGFRFAQQFAAEARYENQSRTIGEMVADQTHRIMMMLRRGNWHITGHAGERIPNKWGGDVRAFCYPLAEIANIIVKDYYAIDYHDRFSRNLGRAIFSSFNWGFSMQAPRNRAMSYELVSAYGGWNQQRIALRTLDSDQVMYALAYSALENLPWPDAIDRTEIATMIKSVPWEGICFETPGCTAPEGWRSAHRWVHPTHKNGNKYGLKMEWNGIDYMLFYNLYHYLNKEHLPPYKRIMLF
jgi:hypothetical protein